MLSNVCLPDKESEVTVVSGSMMRQSDRELHHHVSRALNRTVKQLLELHVLKTNIENG